MSHRYITDRQLPDKAIDLIDEAASRLKMGIDSKPAELDRVDRQILQLEIEGESLEKERDKASRDRLQAIEAEIAELKEEANGLRARWETEKAAIDKIRETKAKMDEVKVQIEQAERQMVFLASVGAAAPFVGLFGTVWGIMNSFASIAASKNTSLAVVAPGIAEALFATALGLVAAIPAVLAYNKLSGDIGRYGHRLEAFAGEFGAILSRQLEEKR